jgi:peptidoglycan/LPS O-acetylase OafA/YrhL
MNKPVPLSDANARDASLDHLRAFIVLLVLMHHSLLAYAVLWPAQSRTFEILPAPIVDPQRWLGFDVLTTFNDTFFMALMFLLSGLFVWPSIERKGGAGFLRERSLRLGLPFIVAVGILMPIAYYPTYVVTGADPSFLAYARSWLSLGFWPSGPAWFIWLLLFFDVLAVGLHVLQRRLTANTRALPNLGVLGHPPAFVAMLLVVSALVYVPMELAFGAERWLTLGPFSFQASRLLLYAVYFLIGIRMGVSGTGFGSGMVQQWPVWLSAGLAAFALHLAVIVTLVLPVSGAHRAMPLDLRLLSDLTFVLCCGTVSFAFIALFRRFAIAHQPIFDSFGTNSYGMYLIHYPVVVWLQFALLTVPLGPIAKGAMVCLGAVALSWGIVVALRQMPAIARVL